MPDASLDLEQTSAKSDISQRADFDSVCVDVPRIYDSCCAKDCLSNLPVYFSAQNQSLVEEATSVRLNKASVSNAIIKVDSVAFHTGFYSVDMVFYFSVCCDIYSGSGSLPTTINGVATYGKRVVLYGSSGDIKSFASDASETAGYSPNTCCSPEEGSLPKATVNVSNPMGLSSKLVKPEENVSLPYIPSYLIDAIGGELSAPVEKQVLVTLGIFTITRLQRNVQLLIPSYDFCVPRKECAVKTDDPCEVFSQIEFPTDSFFPPSPIDSDSGTSEQHCSCCNSE